MTPADRQIIEDLLDLIDGGIFPGKGKRRDEMVERARAHLALPEIEVHIDPRPPDVIIVPVHDPRGGGLRA